MTNSDQKLDENQIILTEIVDHLSDQLQDQRRDQRQRHSMARADSGRDIELDLRERVARLKKYVARPKIYSRVTASRVKCDQNFECSWPGCDSMFKVRATVPVPHF